jgi:DNA-binding response OmpR family regulator
VIAAVYPEGITEGLSDALALSGVSVKTTDDLGTDSATIREADVLIVELGLAPLRQLREVARVEEMLGLPVLVVMAREHLAILESSGVAADFVLAPVDPLEFRIRVNRLVTVGNGDEVLTFKDLELNPLNHQATLDGEPMDLTYMEYELLRFLVENPVRVWSREQLLSKVWGYEYYGGARTVDVHVRRLRSKLGEGRASWITTVRSVGYRWG